MSPDEHHIDSIFMQRAMSLAKNGMGQVSPNPLVGCVIVHDNKIVGEGWHQQYGGPHAEVNAIQSVTDKALLPETTVYVNLEPCSHFGKTPPCADLLIDSKVRKVVIANLDTNPKVAGEGIKKMRASGIEVVTGILDHAGRELNKRFFTFIEKKRPYIILKWAQTRDGFIARLNRDSKWISNEYSRQLVHKWRTEEDAILVGTKTAEFDNPQLNVRDWSGRNPVRIVLDRFLKLPESLHLFDRSQKTICYNLLKHEERENLLLIRIAEENFLAEMMMDLVKRNIQSVIVEGGAQTLQSFTDARIWDEARVFTGDKSFDKGIKAPEFEGKINSEISIFSDRLSFFSPGS